MLHLFLVKSGLLHGDPVITGIISYHVSTYFLALLMGHSIQNNELFLQNKTKITNDKFFL